jgi:hypothetical protein
MSSGEWIKRTGDGNESGLRKLLKGWSIATEKYCEAMGGGEAPFFFNERANISMLAAGAWLQGGVALEEYSASKFREDRESNGRCDLYVYLNNCNFEIEAKSVKTRLPSEPSLSLHLRKKFDEAVADANSLTPQKNMARIACVFYALRVEASRHLSQERLDIKYEEELERYKFALKKIAECDAIAWCTPESIKRLRTNSDSDEFIFGCMIGMKVIP